LVVPFGIDACALGKMDFMFIVCPPHY
jgi:hypothetical protein